MMHPDTLRIACDAHQNDLLREAARDRLADTVPRVRSHAHARSVLSHFLRSLADALEPPPRPRGELVLERSRREAGAGVR
jgi:hypothetical protein